MKFIDALIHCQNFIPYLGETKFWKEMDEQFDRQTLMSVVFGTVIMGSTFELFAKGNVSTAIRGYALGLFVLYIAVYWKEITDVDAEDVKDAASDAKEKVEDAVEED